MSPSVSVDRAQEAAGSFAVLFTPFDLCTEGSVFPACYVCNGTLYPYFLSNKTDIRSRKQRSMTTLLSAFISEVHVYASSAIEVYRPV